MSDYSEQRHNILMRMATVSKGICYNRDRIKCEKVSIQESEEAIVTKQKEIDEYEIELMYLLNQLKDEFQEE
jgi:hypothetical protein